MMRISAPEQHLLDFAREEFGEKLADFLLAGLGEDVTGQRWRFTITYVRNDSSLLRRHIEVITHEPEDGSSSLPRWRDPLVLLTLLQLLLRGDHKSPNSLCYTQEQVLSLLGWKDTTKTRRDIDKAMQRYFLLTYKWKMSKTELNRRNLNFYTANESLISEHESLNVKAEGANGLSRMSSRIVFNEHFIEQLLCKSLFGITWNSVRSLSRSSPSKK